MDVMLANSGGMDRFREDINGLRAWAVCLVVLYHFQITPVVGGFVGVDVFFVISGFLMTGIILRGMDSSGGFSLKAFYASRVRRIVPALLVLCVALLVLGWFFLVSFDYRKLASHVQMALLFVSNIRFHREAGYFDVASHDKWLLHTWSLSVEWQFYLLLPLVMMAVWRIRSSRKLLACALVLVTCGCYFWSQWIFSGNKNSAFYLLQGRAWEMLVGSLVYISLDKMKFARRQRAVMEFFGLAIILFSAMWFDASDAWPSWRAMVPVGGACLVLMADRSGSPWTGLSAIQWMGARSYSIYLWHWPVVVALSYLQLGSNLYAILVGLFFTLFLGHASYHLVENPVRLHGSFSRTRVVFALVLGLTVCLVGAALIKANEGLPGRLSPEIEMAAAESNNINVRQKDCFARGGVKSPGCQYGGDHLKAILIGDSHADAVTTALAASLNDPRDGVQAWTYVSCPILIGVKNLALSYTPEQKCGDFVTWAFERLSNIPNDVPVFVVNRHAVYARGHNEEWEGDGNMPLVYFTVPHRKASDEFLVEYSDRLVETTCRLAKQRRVFLVRPLPELAIDVPKTYSRGLALGYERDVSMSLVQYHERNNFIWKAQDIAKERCGVTILDPLPYLCDANRCPGVRNGRPLYYDDDHLSEHGNRLLIPMFAAAISLTSEGVLRH